MKPRKPETQMTLPSVPEAKATTMWRVNFQYQGPNYALRAGSLMIPSDTIEHARIIAQSTLKDQHGDKWFNVTKIQNVTTLNDDQPPF